MTMKCSSQRRWRRLVKCIWSTTATQRIRLIDYFFLAIYTSSSSADWFMVTPDLTSRERHRWSLPWQVKEGGILVIQDLTFNYINRTRKHPSGNLVCNEGEEYWWYSIRDLITTPTIRDYWYSQEWVETPVKHVNDIPKSVCEYNYLDSDSGFGYLN